MKDKNRNMYIGLGILVLVLIIIGVLVNNHYQKNEQANNNPADATLTNPSVTPTPAASPTAVGGSLTYQQAVAKYKERFQFASCSQGTPNSIAVRAGTQIMLDNRDKVSHTFTVSGVKYATKAYGFAIVTTRTIANAPILCDGKNSVTLNVEK